MLLRNYLSDKSRYNEINWSARYHFNRNENQKGGQSNSGYQHPGETNSFFKEPFYKNIEAQNRQNEEKKISASELMEKGNIKEHRIELYHVFSKNFLRTKFIGDGEILRPPSIGRNLLVLIKKSAESRYFKYVRVHF